MNSPIFPPASLTAAEDNNERSFIPVLPEKPLVATGSIQVFVIPAEKNLFVEGFSAAEYGDRPPTLLRGCLYVRVLKPTKIKTISLNFKGIQRTDWPEGIPPKKNNFAELNDIVNHTWPFYNQLQGAVVNGGADHYQELPKCTTSKNGTEVDISHLSLSETQARSMSPLPRTATDSNVAAAATGFGEFFARTISLSPVTAGIMRKATTSNAPSGRSLSPSPSTNSLTSSALNDLHTVSTDSSGVGQFNPGDYIYNFEHPVPPSTPESVKVTFGEVSYHLDVSITRPGTFKSNLSGRLPINIVRIPSEDNLEENEPIVISRDWEDQLKYEIVIGSKSVVLDSYLPLAFRFIPLFGKVALHRIRVYLSENLEYYCNNKKVHRMEPPKKFLLLEHKALKGKSLLSKAGGLDPDGTDIPLTIDEEDEILPRELEFQVFIPHKLQDRTNHKIHPDTSFEVIQSHHWIKICLRISRFDPENPEKRKHYEIRIDSPINILSPLCVHANTLLPEYNEIDRSLVPDNNVLSIDATTTPPVSPGVIPVGGSVLNNNFLQTNSLDALMDQDGRTGRSFLTEASGNRSRSRSNSSSVRTFQHIQTSGNQDEPIERDYDMHLESNLYKPKDDGESIYNSPQAMPFESPVGSPIQRPIHLLRKPSINPPTFDSISGPPLMTNPPPEYEVEDSGIHRNDSQVFDEELNTPVDEELEVKEEHLLRGRRRTQTEGETLVEGGTSKSNTEENAISFKVTQPTPIERSPQQLPLVPSQVTPSIDDAMNAEGLGKDLEQDIVDGFKSVHGPVAINPENFNLSPKLRAVGSRSRSTSPSRTNGDQRYSYDSSRRSSITSTTSLNSSVGMAPLIERTPLLNESSASLEHTTSSTSQFNVAGRNTSIISLLQAHGGVGGSVPVPSGIAAKKMSFGLADLNDDIYKVNGNLLSLRNPRIKKHYQDSELANGSDEEFEPPATTQKSRQKSFGVVNMNHKPMNNTSNSNSNSNSSESDNTSTEDAEQSTTTFAYKEETPQKVTGLNLNYIIE
ncbi:arrestin-related trafficking adapter 3 [[Candida] railenensis]|uniref:Arrestin-related trafficking adapter 3 n=1 Tax=[Candida] railenensis TaxID=45579 RepID=A0A9P0QTA7_9ASCO|nr:arrestin-related trafficking adapter 3 [[Candida] railenensis]